MWFVDSCFGMRLLCVWCRQKTIGAPFDLCAQQNVLCSLNELTKFVRGKHFGGEQFVSINSVYK